MCVVSLVISKSNYNALWEMSKRQERSAFPYLDQQEVLFWVLLWLHAFMYAYVSK